MYPTRLNLVIARTSGISSSKKGQNPVKDWLVYFTRSTLVCISKTHREISADPILLIILKIKDNLFPPSETD